MSIFNKGVLLFRTRNFRAAIKFWNLIGYQRSKHANEMSPGSKKVMYLSQSTLNHLDEHKQLCSHIFYRIPLLLNLCIAHFLDGSQEISLELSQELINQVTSRLINSTCEGEYIDFIKIDDLQIKINALLAEILKYCKDQRSQLFEIAKERYVDHVICKSKRKVPDESQSIVGVGNGSNYVETKESETKIKVAPIERIYLENLPVEKHKLVV